MGTTSVALLDTKSVLHPGVGIPFVVLMGYRQRGPSLNGAGTSAFSFHGGEGSTILNQGSDVLIQE